MTLDVHTGGEGRSFEFNGRQDMDLKPDYELVEPAHVSGNCMGAGESVYVVSGEIKLAIRGVCARCTDEALHSMDIRFEERFEKEPEDEDNYTYNGDVIDLTRALTDNVILNLPGRILCRDDCKGLCPKCGANLNEAGCDCTEGDENPFAVLRRLRLPEEE